MLKTIVIILLSFGTRNCFSQFYIRLQTQQPKFSNLTFNIYTFEFSDKNVRQFSLPPSTNFIGVGCDSTKPINLSIDGTPGFITGCIINCGDSIIADLDKNTFQVLKRKP